jgi:caa(3)-type oxidase subunit IV
MAEHAHNPNKYRNIYLVLLVLLVVSILGPELGIFWVTLVTAFGIALVKAALVVREFMHLKDERKLVTWLLVTSVLLMVLLFAGVAPDVMRHEGKNWENLAAKAAVERGLAADAAGETAHD